MKRVLTRSRMQKVWEACFQAFPPHCTLEYKPKVLQRLWHGKPAVLIIKIHCTDPCDYSGQ